MIEKIPAVKIAMARPNEELHNKIKLRDTKIKKRKEYLYQFFTDLYQSHTMQVACFWAKLPWTLPPQKVPATIQQSLPWCGFAGHTPISFALIPPCSLPHFLNSQQFFIAILYHPLCSYLHTNIKLDGKKV